MFCCGAKRAVTSSTTLATRVSRRCGGTVTSRGSGSDVPDADAEDVDARGAGGLAARRARFLAGGSVAAACTALKEGCLALTDRLPGIST